MGSFFCETPLWKKWQLYSTHTTIYLPPTLCLMATMMEVAPIQSSEWLAPWMFIFFYFCLSLVNGQVNICSKWHKTTGFFPLLQEVCKQCINVGQATSGALELTTIVNIQYIIDAYFYQDLGCYCQNYLSISSRDVMKLLSPKKSHKSCQFHMLVR